MPKDNGGYLNASKNASDVHPGLTQRDYFAAQALNGLLANGHYLGDAVGLAYRLADDMLKQRET